MASLFDAMSIARSGVLTQQERMAIISHNIVNVNTPGYHRQRALLETTPPNQPNIYTTARYDLGTGVRVAGVTRDYVDAKETLLRDTLSDGSSHSQMAGALTDLEGILTSGEEGSLSSALRGFWNAWHDVAANPTNVAMRNVLLEKSGTLVSSFNRVAKSLDQYSASFASGTGPFTGTLPLAVDEVNRVATEIQDLNARIARGTAMGTGINDLKDKRDELVKNLSTLVNISVDATGNVLVDGQTLVTANGDTRNDLTMDTASPVAFSVGGNSVAITGGEIGGAVQVLNVVTTLRADVDAMANELAVQVNAVHTAGYDLNGQLGLDFFTGVNADGIQVNVALYNPMNPLLNAPELVAAANTQHDPLNPDPNVGDGANALELADLAEAGIGVLGGRTFGIYFSDLASSLGSRAATEQALADDSATSSNLLLNTIQAESGVSLDEETVDMLSAQRAFQAASKLVGVVDEMILTVLAMKQ